MSFVHGGQEGAAPVGSGGGVWGRGLGAGSGGGVWGGVCNERKQGKKKIIKTVNNDKTINNLFKFSQSPAVWTHRG